MTAWLIGAAALVLATGAQQDGAMVPGMAMPGVSGTPTTCPATPAPVPGEFRGWTAPTPLVAGGDDRGAPSLPIGTAARVTLGDAAMVRYAAQPEHAPPTGSHGGLLALTITSAGRYRVGLGNGAWVDLVQGIAALRSVGHGHGPACSTLKKIVDFDLQPGRYLLQLSGSAAPTLAVMVVRAAPGGSG